MEICTCRVEISQDPRLVSTADLSGLEIFQDWRFVRNGDLSGTEIFQARRVTILVNHKLRSKIIFQFFLDF